MVKVAPVTIPSPVMPTIRPATIDVLGALAAAQHQHFSPWAKVVDKRRPSAAALEFERKAFEALQAAALTAREYTRHEPEKFEAERLQLTQLYCLEDHACDQAVHRVSSGAERNAIRADWNERRIQLLDLSVAAMVAAGWPHRLEKVIVSCIYHPNAPSAAGGPRQVKWAGPAQYVGANDTAHVSHTVEPLKAPTDLEPIRGRHHLTVSWTPLIGGAWGMADPDGGILMHLADAPDKELPRPFPRFPTWFQAGLPEPGVVPAAPAVTTEKAAAQKLSTARKPAGGLLPAEAPALFEM